MSLSKTRIIGFALEIVLLICFMDKELYGYEGEFHERIVDVTFEMMSPQYRSLPREYLKKGSTQPDADRKKFQKNPLNLPMIPIDNEEHKRDTTRINNNYGEAIDRYKQHAGEGNREKGRIEGARILAKVFHYVSDQTEPEESRGFSNLMGKGFRGIAQKKLKDVMAKDKQLFFDKVKRLHQGYQFNPRDKEFVRKEIPKIRNDLEKAIKDILATPNLNKDKAKQEKAKNDIDRLILDYLAQIVAIQNVMLEQFNNETEAFRPSHTDSESRSSPMKTETPPQTKSGSWPLKTKTHSSVTKDMKEGEERCRQIESALEATPRNDMDRFRALVEQAKVENCDFYQNALVNLEKLERQAAVESADCSQWPGTEPRWNDRTNRVDCFCAQGKSWNRDHTACIDERQAALEKADCSRWPGSIARWNNQTSRVECFCPDGMAKHRDNTKCISCADYENRFAAAYNANQLNAAQGFLEEAVNCPWYGKAADALKKRGQYLAEQNEKERKCNDLYNGFLNALRSKQFEQARGILTQAKDCGFQQQGYNDLCNQIGAVLTEAKGRKDIRQFRLFLPQARGCAFFEQANADLRQMELDEHCNKIGTALNEAKRLKDINRFRTLLTQAQNCGFYQQALADLRKMEGDQVQAKTKPAPPQPPPAQQPSGHPSDPQYRQRCVTSYQTWDGQLKQWVGSTGFGSGSTSERILSWSNAPCPQGNPRKTGPKSVVESRRYWDNCAQKYYCAEVEKIYK